jgi:YEATS family
VSSNVFFSVASDEGKVKNRLQKLIYFLSTFSPGRAPYAEGHPMRAWNVTIFLLNENGEEMTANIFDKVVYKLHPSFANHTQSTYGSSGRDCGNW